jgi:hypothetical protein
MTARETVTAWMAAHSGRAGVDLGELLDQLVAMVDEADVRERGFVVEYLGRFADGFHFAGAMREEKALRAARKDIAEGRHVPQRSGT